MSPFDFVNAITLTKDNLMVDDASEKAYNSFMVNRALSYFPDTVLYANEINTKPQLDNRLKFDFLLNAIPKRKRFSKWIKAVESEPVELVKRYYGYSEAKARSALTLLTEADIETLRMKVNKGGNTKTSK